MGLFDFLKKIPTLNELQGSLGEWMAKLYATTMPDALVLSDVLIEGANGYTSQIDMILVGNRGIYVVELKMYPDAKIYGDSKKSKWYYYNHGKKYEIYSPLRQNKKHIEYLKAFLKDFGDVPCFSVVAIVCEDIKISGELNKEDELYTAVCTSFPSMERAIYKLASDKPDVFDDAKKREIYEYIKSKQFIGREARFEHKQNVIQYKEKLDSMEKQKICPYCKSELVLRNGKNGKFYGCSKYPKCRYTMNVK